MGRPGGGGVRRGGYESDRVVSLGWGSEWGRLIAHQTAHAGSRRLSLTSEPPSSCIIRSIDTHLTRHAPHPPRVTPTRIDVFAVRQWPGNGADLDFRGVLEGCTAAIVAAAPIEGTLLKARGDKESISWPDKRQAFLESDEYAAVAKVLPFCRLWCVRAGWHSVHFVTRSPRNPIRPPISHAHPPTHRPSTNHAISAHPT